jgi:hypothetical protein
MGDETSYFWVVLCKNRGFHNRYNLFSRHCIVLSETDALSPPPGVNTAFQVVCDDCGHSYTYKPKDVLRAELDASEPYTPHPLFREDFSDAANALPPATNPSAPETPRTVLTRIRTAVSPYFSFLRRGA